MEINILDEPGFSQAPSDNDTEYQQSLVELHDDPIKIESEDTDQTLSEESLNERVENETPLQVPNTKQPEETKPQLTLI